MEMLNTDIRDLMLKKRVTAEQVAKHITNKGTRYVDQEKEGISVRRFFERLRIKELDKAEKREFTQAINKAHKINQEAKKAKTVSITQEEPIEPPKKKRGRPRKNPAPLES